MGQNTKKSNTTKRSDKAQTKTLQKLQKDLLFYDPKLIRDLFEGPKHDSMNCSEILVTALTMPPSWRKFDLKF